MNENDINHCVDRSYESIGKLYDKFALDSSLKLNQESTVKLKVITEMITSILIEAECYMKLVENKIERNRIDKVRNEKHIK